jgi:hypothetical protein
VGEARLLFWLRLSFLVDAAFVALAVLLVLDGEAAGWYLLAFTALRVVLGVVALFWIAPHLIRGRDAGTRRPASLSGGSAGDRWQSARRPVMRASGGRGKPDAASRMEL